MLSYHILGVEHSRQKLDRHLKTKLESIVEAKRTVLIAEEVNANQPDAQQKSIARDLATARKIPWRSIDMNFKQQEDAGIKEELDHAHHQHMLGVDMYPAHAHDVREDYWLDRIEEECRARAITDGTVLVICGRRHPHSLADKARKRGINDIDLSEHPAGLGKQVGEPDL
jgi:hypothetical protein